MIGVSRRRAASGAVLLAALSAFASHAAYAQPHPRPMATGSARVRERTRETRFHLLIDGHAVSLGVETGRCPRRAGCERTWHFLFEGLLHAATPEIVASFTRAQSRAARPPEPVPMEPSTARLVCRTPLTLGTTRVVGRCRLIGPLPPAWRDLPRAFRLTRSGGSASARTRPRVIGTGPIGHGG